MKNQDVITQQLKQKYLDFYYKTLEFFPSKNTSIQTQGHRVPCFYLSILHFDRSTTEVSSYNSTPLYTGAQPVSRYACPSCRCQPLKQPVWHLQKCSRAAHGHPVSIPMQRGAQNGALRTVNQTLRCACLLSDPHALAGVLMLHSWVYAWQSASILEEECGAPLKGQLRYTHSDQIWNQNYPQPSLQYQCLKCIWEKSCVLFPDFC